MDRVFMLLIAALCVPSMTRAESVCPSLVITGHPAYPPVAWASHGNIVGAGPELVASIARQLGVRQVVSKDYGFWINAQHAARMGQADVILGIYKNNERAKYLNYIEPPFMLDPVVVVVRKGEGFALSNWDDLKGRRGVTNAGESYGDRFDAFMAKQLTVKRVRGVKNVFEALVNHQADYLIIGLYPGKDEARRLGISDKVEFLPGKLETFEMYVAFSKRSKCYAALSRSFAAGIKRAVQQGRVKQLLDSAERQFEK